MKHCSLYIHIPFCVKKCDYCDFASYAGKTGLIGAYLDALAREADAMLTRFGPMTADTIFIGGGTPSIMSGSQINKLMAIVRSRFTIAAGAEITMEANPGTLTPEKLKAAIDSGINRLSIGVQSFDDGLLRALGRIHTASEAKDAVFMAQNAGFENISIDLMYALPGQTREQWLKTLDTALSLPISHISCYSLIVEEGTPLAERVNRDPAVLPDDEACIGMQHEAARFLAQHGFERYEVSNYALPGYESRHNTVYWDRGDYLGLGCAAHSLMNGVRFSNGADLEVYINGSCEHEEETLGADDIYEETVMLGLRTRKGISADILCGREKKANALISEGLLVLQNGRLCATEKGMDVLNAVILALI